MSGKKRTEEELRNALRKAAYRVIRDLGKLDKPLFTAIDVAVIVSAAQELWGRKYVNRQIHSYLKERNLLNAGICIECMKQPSTPEEGLCKGCKEESDNLQKEMVADMILEEMGETPLLKYRLH